MISEAELVVARESLAASLDSTCTVVRAGAPVSDGAGGTTPGADATIHPAGTPCRYHPATSSREQQAAERFEVVAAIVLVLAHGSDLAVGDRAVLDTGDVLEVQGLFEPRTWDVDVRALCERRG